MQYFHKTLYTTLNFGGTFMKKILSIFITITLVFCLLFTGCRNTTDTNSESSDTIQTSTPNMNTQEKSPSKNIMVNYYDMTMQDIIDIWGADYVISDYLLDAAFASIYYENDDCPFVFFYRSYTDFAPDTCDTSEKITGIKVKTFSRSYENVYVTQDIPITASYEFVSAKLEGKYTPDDMLGGNTFECTSIENVDVVWFNWQEDKDVPSRLLLHFDNVHDIDYEKNNSTK